jgi:hypothetical protein
MSAASWALLLSPERITTPKAARKVRPLGEWEVSDPRNPQKIAWRKERMKNDPEYRARRYLAHKLWYAELKSDPVKWEAWRQKRTSYELARRQRKEAANPALAEARRAQTNAYKRRIRGILPETHEMVDKAQG